MLQQDDSNNVSDTFNDAKSAVNDAFAKFYGGSCQANSQCADVVAECKDNECRPVWWFWAIIAAVVASLVLSCVCCICCGLCACIADCLCSCCR